MEFSTFGRHVAIDTWGVDFNLLNDPKFLEARMIEAAHACGATVLSTQAQKFEPQGATVLVMLSESHISIHTYPEKGFAALDCYTCGETVDPEVAIEYLVKVLKPQSTSAKILRRGDGPIRELVRHPIKDWFLKTIATISGSLQERFLVPQKSETPKW